MRGLLRLLGVTTVARAGSHLPGPVGPVISALTLVLVNLVPVWLVVDGRLGMGEVFLLYWFENVVVWFTSSAKIATAGAEPSADNRSLAGFFAVHFGIFTVVHGVFTVILAVAAGLAGSLQSLLLAALAILVSHLVSLGLNWFGRDERALATPQGVMFAPYPRMLALHVAVIGGWFLVLGLGSGTTQEVLAVVVLCIAKTVLDLGFHLRERRAAGRPTRVTLRVNGRVVHRS